MAVFLSAIWLGVLTSISPCPLASNIAAVSFLSKKINHPKAVLWAGIAYTLGRMTSYAILGVVIIGSLFSIPTVANLLQKYMNIILGPLLLAIGLFLLGIIKFNISGFSLSIERQNALVESGIKGSFILGAVFALSFCPISAALFFGTLIPLALNNRYGIIFPFLYGIGTALPVMIFTLAISLGAASVSHWFHKARQLEGYTKKITGIIFILVAIYYIRNYIVSLFYH
ncbi:MAG: sulfite exporter TauE/SafE family protein [Candidatus Omnitrophota bacterium]|nr:MAG: sulfite exporter TauE/SafE family protein [Candidatus Omnitrophota bacterium]